MRPVGLAYRGSKKAVGSAIMIKGHQQSLQKHLDELTKTGWHVGIQNEPQAFHDRVKTLKQHRAVKRAENIAPTKAKGGQS